MFIKFFDNLRQSGVPVSLREYLTFLEALTKNIGTYEVENFYILARTIMVKDERHLDRFDIAFSHTFNGLDELSLEEIINKTELPDDWLKKLAEKHLSEEELAEMQPSSEQFAQMEELNSFTQLEDHDNKNVVETDDQISRSFLVMEEIDLFVMEEDLKEASAKTSKDANKKSMKKESKFDFIQCDFIKDDGNRCKRQAPKNGTTCSVHRKLLKKRGL